MNILERGRQCLGKTLSGVHSVLGICLWSDLVGYNLIYVMDFSAFAVDRNSAPGRSSFIVLIRLSTGGKCCKSLN